MAEDGDARGAYRTESGGWTSGRMDGWMDGEDPEDGEQGVEMEGDFEIRLGAQTGAQARKWGTPV